MTLHDDIADLIGNIYQSAHDPTVWDNVLDGLLYFTGSRFTMVSTVDLKRGQYASNRFYGPGDGRFLDGVDEYNDHMHRSDPTLAFAKRHPDAGFVSMQMALADASADIRDTNYARWTRGMLGVGESLVCYTKADDDLMIGVSLHAPAVRGGHSAEEIRLFKLLFGHLKRSIHIATRPIDLRDGADAVLIVEHDGRVSAMSGAAESLLANGDGLSIRSHRLQIDDMGEAARFGALLRSALGVISDGGLGGGMRVGRPSGKPPWLLRVAPLPSPHGAFERLRGAASVKILNFSAPWQGQDRTSLAQLFGLTPTEAIVATYLERGMSDQAIAGYLTISLNTVRSHVKSVLAKTGIRTKAELAHTLTLARR